MRTGQHPCQLRALNALPPGFDHLAEETSAEGHSFLARMRREWRDGRNRFDRAGELLLAAVDAERLLAVGGLNQDPYAKRPRIGRLRHLYVRACARRLGIASLLVDDLLNHAAAHFEVVRLRTDNPAAAAFYLKKGFRAVREEHATHLLRLSGSPKVA